MYKKENICEIILLGFTKKPASSDSIHIEPFLSIDEVFENTVNQYNYSIKTYTIEPTDFTNRAISTIEYHTNNNLIKNKVSTDSNLFYNKVKYMNKLDDFILFSKHYIKYISSTIINSDIGKASIVELSRCDKNMADIINNLGYRLKSERKISGYLWKYKSFPIIGILCQVKKQNDKPNYILEIRGLCMETEKNKLCQILYDIKDKLSSQFIFE